MDKINALHILKETTGNTMEKFSSHLLDIISSYADSKIEYELIYRESHYRDGVGRIIDPEPVHSYFSKSDIKFGGQNIGSIIINDQNYASHGYYKNMFIITNFVDHNPINEIYMEIKPIIDATYLITREYAKLFGLAYQIGPNYYLIDISKVITTFAQTFIDNRYFFPKKEEIKYRFRNKEQIMEEFNERVKLYPIEPQPEDNKDPQPIGIKISLTLERPCNGAATVYLF